MSNPQVTVGVGYLPDGTFTPIYAGLDYAAAKKAVDDQGIAGTIQMGFILRNPAPEEVFRYGAVPPPAPVPGPPQILTLVPNSAPAYQQVTLNITGTGFDHATAQILVGSTWTDTQTLTPSGSPSSTNLTATFYTGSDPVAYLLKVVNGDGQESGSMQFTVTSNIPAPTITALNPNTGPAGADITVAITGTGFDSAPTVTIGSAHGLVPTSITPTNLSVLLSGAANIQFPGSLPMSVQNSDGQVSNTLDFTAT